jgi:hypothetical protein
MPILTSSKSWRALVQAVREIRLGAPFESEPALRAFYGELLGLRERALKPKIPGGWMVGNSRAHIYFQHRHLPVSDPLRRRLTIAVPSLKLLEKRLKDARWSYRRRHGLNFGDDLLLITDPAGHVVEVRQSQPL